MRTLLPMLLLASFASSVRADYQIPDEFIYKSLEFRKTVTIDTVAKVLNYTDGYPDEGSEYGFWYLHDAKNCIYRKANNKDGITSANGKVVSFDVNPVAREINLNSYDKKSLFLTSQKFSYPARGIVEKFEIQLDGRVIFSGEGLDVQRLKRGWGLIYSKYCTGTKKEF